MFEIRLPERENFRKLAISRLTKKNIAHMNNITFKKDLLGDQDELLRFAYNHHAQYLHQQLPQSGA